MRVLVTGDRNWKSVDVIERVLSTLPPGTIIVEGGARGADAIAERTLVPFLTVIRYAANWGQYGKAAGVIRNLEMLNTAPDRVLAFHNDINSSKGTAHCVQEAMKRHIEVHLYNEEGVELSV